MGYKYLVSGTFNLFAAKLTTITHRFFFSRWKQFRIQSICKIAWLAYEQWKFLWLWATFYSGIFISGSRIFLFWSWKKANCKEKSSSIHKEEDSGEFFFTKIPESIKKILISLLHFFALPSRYNKIPWNNLLTSAIP